MNDLEPTAQKLLNKDPNNPNSPKKGEPAVRPGLGLSKSTLGTSKPTLREAMMAQKKANLAAKNLPARPGSAMAHFSPVRTASSTSTASASSSAAAPLRQRPESTIAVGSGSGGMSVAPMRPIKRRPELATRPATAGPYSVRTHDGTSMEAISPESLKSKTATPRTKEASPRRTGPRPRPGHATHASESSLPSPTKAAITKAASSPRGSPGKLKKSLATLASSSPSAANEELTLVVPTLANLRATPPKAVPPPKPSPIPEALSESGASTPAEPLKVYEDPFTDDQSTPKATFIRPVLEDKPVNEDAANLMKGEIQEDDVNSASSPDKARQNQRLLESGITRVGAKSLDVHGFRKLQSLLRDSKSIFTDDKFEALLKGLFEYLEASLSNMAQEKVQDVKAQILATIKILLKKERANFQPHVSRGLESLMKTRSAYDTRAHIVSGLELLADELIALGDPPEIVMTMTKMLGNASDTTTDGCRSLSMGLHVLKELLDKRTSFTPTDTELVHLSGLANRCLESGESGVRMDAVQLCVALHARVGEQKFWESLNGLKEDPKSLITYYIVKRQRDGEATPA
jgi:CLIP-associating protein 1/2